MRMLVVAVGLICNAAALRMHGARGSEAAFMANTTGTGPTLVPPPAVPAGTMAVGVNPQQERNAMPCDFYDETGKSNSEICTIESQMHPLVFEFVKPGDKVLELGARYGTTTCAAAKASGNAGHVVAVDPDSTIWNALQKNLAAHHCKSYVLHGLLGASDKVIVKNTKVGKAYGTRTGFSGSRADPDAVTAKHIRYAELEKNLGWKFDVLIIDCEGCAPALLAENPEIFDAPSLKTLIIETDKGITKLNPTAEEYHKAHNTPNVVNYDTIIGQFETKGFKLVKDINGVPKYRWPDGTPGPHEFDRLHHVVLRREA